MTTVELNEDLVLTKVSLEELFDARSSRVQGARGKHCRDRRVVCRRLAAPIGVVEASVRCDESLHVQLGGLPQGGGLGRVPGASGVSEKARGGPVHLPKH